MAGLVLEHVSKTFQKRNGEKLTALHDLNLTVQDKELLVVVGPSGSGKTTLLRLIAGLEEPSSGKILFENQVLNHVAAQKRDIAMVFQNPALFPHMSVRENIAFGLKLRKFSKRQIEQLVTEAAELLALTEHLEQMPMALSGGQRQRVAVGRAIVRRPKLFLFDEPLSNLDPQMRTQLRLEINKLHQRLSTTVIYVTHDQAEAMTLGQRVAVLNEGTIHQVDDPLSLHRHPVNLFVAGFFGSPPMNLFNGTLSLEGEQVFFIIERGANELDNAQAKVLVNPAVAPGLKDFVNRAVILGIRPEHICKAVPGRNCVGAQTVTAVVKGTDFLGAETHLHVARGKHEFVARLAGDQHLQTLKPLDLEFKMSQAHFFDPATGRQISSKING